MAENMNGTNRNIDIVFCIDGTGSMAPCIESVKSNATRFWKEFSQTLVNDFHTEIDSLRVKVITFRDYESEGGRAIQESNFFELPEDNEEYEDYLSDISADGGGDAPENGLEALYYAMKSDFTTGSKDRQVIVLFTDADSLDLKERMSEQGYPFDMVDEDGLVSTWACVSQAQDLKLRDRAKRLILFAPTGTKYEELASKLDRAYFEPVAMEDGLKDLSFDAIIKSIAASVSNKS